MGERDPDGGGPCLAGVRVLVVDDDACILDCVAEMLAERGATVIAVATAVQALDTVRRDCPDVLVSDLAMPENDGYWLIRMIRAMPREQNGTIPAVAFTGDACVDRDRVLASGFHSCLMKPEQMDRLAAVVAILARSTERPDAMPGDARNSSP